MSKQSKVKDQHSLFKLLKAEINKLWKSKKCGYLLFDNLLSLLIAITNYV
jgi:hypothetical protein